MRRHRPPTEQLRAAGRKRAEQFSPEYQIEMGRRRAQQASFVAHNRQIAHDGFRAQSAYMRAPSGLRLLSPDHVQFLLPKQLYGPNGILLTYEQQRLYFGLYVWKAIWNNLSPLPAMPTDAEFLATIGSVQARLQSGLPLAHPLDIIYAAANDYCDEAGEPWSQRKQRRLFRADLCTGRAAAEELVVEWRHQAQAERAERPRQLGQRRPSVHAEPAFRHRQVSPQQYRYGRPDLPSYHPYNITPQRPYEVPAASPIHPVYWLPMPDTNEEED